MNEKSFNYHVVCHHLFIKKKSLVDSNILTFFSNTYCRLNMDGDRFLGKPSDPLIMIFKNVTYRSIYASDQLKLRNDRIAKEIVHFIIYFLRTGLS